jgi:hypothetical protein
MTPNFNIPIPPFYNQISEMLYGLLTGGRCIKDDSFTVDNTAAVSLVIPVGAVWALLVVEADATATSTDKVVRFTLDGTTVPDAVIGMPLGDLDPLDVKDEKNLSNFKVIGIEAGKTHTVRVQYFK